MTTYKCRGHFYFMAATRDGRKSLATRTTRKRQADAIETMWRVLAEDRCWDLLDPVIAGRRKLPTLFDVWSETGHDVVAMRRRFSDVDLALVVDSFLASYAARGVRPDTVAHVEAHVRALIPTGTPLLASAVTSAWLEQQLTAYVSPPRSTKPDQPPRPPRVAASNTRRKVHSSWSTFFAHCVHPLGIFPANPMDSVNRPGPKRPPISFYEQDEIALLIGAAPTPAMAALWALMYGTGIEISVALQLTRRDVDETTWEVRARGTKTHTRDRVVLVAEWARPTVGAHLTHKFPGAPLWPGYTRWTALDAHTAAAEAAGLRSIPLRNSRHAWAVRACRAGTPIALVAAQLGHSSAQLTLTIYGRFLPQASDRAAWERQATARDAARETIRKQALGQR